MLMHPVLIGLIFIGVLLVVEGIYLLIYGSTLRREARVNRRLALLQEGRDTEEVLSILRAERESLGGKKRAIGIGTLVEQAAHANIVLSPVLVTLILVGLFLLCLVSMTVLTEADLWIRLGAAAIMSYLALFLWLRQKARRRIRLFEEQLPDALDLIVRSLRVGHPITASVAIVAQEMPDPLGTEFGLIADEATYGMTLTDALERLANRMPVPDLRFLAVAISIQSTSGGNLAEILDGLSKVIRSRFKLFRRIQAITAEARWTGWFLSLFPIGALFAVQLVQPDYYDKVADHPLFLPGMILTFILLVLNIVFMRVLVNIKV